VDLSTHTHTHTHAHTRSLSVSLSPSLVVSYDVTCAYRHVGLSLPPLCAPTCAYRRTHPTGLALFHALTAIHIHTLTYAYIHLSAHSTISSGMAGMANMLRRDPSIKQKFEQLLGNNPLGAEVGPWTRAAQPSTPLADQARCHKTRSSSPSEPPSFSPRLSFSSSSSFAP